MHRAKILERLTGTGRLPKAALRAAGERRAEMIPLFMREIEAWTADPDAHPLTGLRLFHYFHLLGAWKASQAYRPVARMLAAPADAVEDALGDAMTETAARVMVNLFDGDPEPLEAVVLEPGANEYARAAMCEALAALAAEGRLPRERVSRFLAEGFERIEPLADNFVWCGWLEAIMALGLVELKPLALQAYEQGSIPHDWCSPKEFEDGLARVLEEIEETGAPRPRVTPFGDAVEELSGWAGFSEGAPAPLAPEFGGPELNPHRDVGRNAACPCGSGRKFKRCCGA